MPCSVEGRCQWGVNKTADGWLFWAKNNDGVIKMVLITSVVLAAGVFADG